jgi:hypothetical protein
MGPIKLALLRSLDQKERKQLRETSCDVLRYVDEAVTSLGEFTGFPRDEDLSLRSLSTRLTEVRTLKLKSFKALDVLSLEQPKNRHLVWDESCGESRMHALHEQVPRKQWPWRSLLTLAPPLVFRWLDSTHRLLWQAG